MKQTQTEFDMHTFTTQPDTYSASEPQCGCNNTGEKSWGEIQFDK